MRLTAMVMVRVLSYESSSIELQYSMLVLERPTMKLSAQDWIGKSKSIQNRWLLGGLFWQNAYFIPE